MAFVVRDFNQPRNDIGHILVYLSKNHKICVDILDLHEDGQAWVYIYYPPNNDIYETILSILNQITTHLSIDNLYIQELEYKDVVSLDEPIENCQYSNSWGHHIPFTRDSVYLLEEEESDREEDDESYVIRGDLLENGELIFNKPIRSNGFQEKHNGFQEKK